MKITVFYFKNLRSKLFHITILLIFVSIFNACKPKPIKVPHKTYIFLGHTYRWYNSVKVDLRIEKIDYSIFDKIMLGGDICAASSQEYSTLNYLDSLFDLGSKNTYWAIGNHDVSGGHQDRISEFTKRNLFYAEYTNGLTIFNLDTQLPSSKRNEQFDLFCQVCDTIKNSTHLLMIMHNVVWDSVSTDFDADDFANGNYPHWPARINPKDYFYHSMYPKLKNVQKKGVQVLLISGDVGQRDTKFFEYQSPEGIQFLASGINNSIQSNPVAAALLPPDHILMLKHYIDEGKITWEFVNLDEYAEFFP